MKPLGISHDYAHCNGDGCEIKEKCIRYLLHKEAFERNLGMQTYVLPPETGENCKYFWKHEDSDS